MTCSDSALGKRTAKILVATIAAGAMLWLAATAFASLTYTAFEAPVAKSTIYGFALARGEVYFLGDGGGHAYVGHVSSSGATDVASTFSDENVFGLASSPGGTLFSTHTADNGGTDSVYQFQPGSEVKTLPLPEIREPGSGERPLFTSIAACNENEVWLAPGGTGWSEVVRFGLDGQMRIFRPKGLVPDTLACGPKDSVWFTGLRYPTKHNSKSYFEVGRISSAGKLRLFRLPTTGVGPKPSAGPIVQGPGGVMWIGSYDRQVLKGRAEQDHNYLARITPDGHIRITKISPKVVDPNRDAVECIAMGPDGHVWIGFYDSGIARVGTPTKIERVPKTSGSCQMTRDHRGNLWFAHNRAIARLTP
jgi:hypothetical protein